jgi:hypothetical protein
MPLLLLQDIGIPACCGLSNECRVLLLAGTPQLWIKDLAGVTGFFCGEKKTLIGQRPVNKSPPAAVSWYA